MFLQADEIPDAEERFNLIMQLLSVLPAHHGRFLKAFCLFLNMLSEHSEITRMASVNLAIVIGPNILRSKNNDLLAVMRYVGILAMF